MLAEDFYLQSTITATKGLSTTRKGSSTPEFIYLQNMHICGNYKQYYPLSVVHTPLCIILSKRVNYILIVRAGNYFQMQSTVLPSFECKKSNENVFCSHYKHVLLTGEPNLHLNQYVLI